MQIEEKYWTYYPKYFDDVDEKKLYDYLSEKVVQRQVSLFDKSFDNPRLSCVFSESKKVNEGKDVSPLFSYEDYPTYSFEDNEIILSIKNKLNNFLKDINYKFEIDYMLAHIYRDGRDYIGYHSDREATFTPVLSVSFGATRKFRLREKPKTKGCDYQYLLNSGDLFIMKPGCQKYYKHTVPKELKIKDWRINLTFRMKDRY